jgi:hypothetical protein
VTQDRHSELMRDAFPDVAEEGDDMRALRTRLLVLLSDPDSDFDVRPPKPPSGGHRIQIALPQRLPRPAALAVGTAIVVVIVLLATLRSSPSALAQKFPIFSTSIQPARAALGVMPAPGTVASASAIRTPNGAAYVIASANDRELCISVPATSLRALLEALEGPQAPPAVRYVGGCVPVARAEHKGAILTSPLKHHRGAEVVVVLPANASEPVIRAEDGNTTQVKVEDGAAVTNVLSPSTLEYEVHGTLVSATIDAHPRHPLVVVPEDH